MKVTHRAIKLKLGSSIEEGAKKRGNRPLSLFPKPSEPCYLIHYTICEPFTTMLPLRSTPLVFSIPFVPFSDLPFPLQEKKPSKKTQRDRGEWLLSISMGAYEATKVVFARLQALEPNLAPNIIGMLLTKDNNEMDMIHLACGPDNLLQSIIAKVRTDLTNKPSPPMASWGFPSDIGEEASFSVDKVGCDGGEEFSSKEYDWRLPIGGNHHRSFLSSTVNTPGWKPCLYYQRFHLQPYNITFLRSTH